MKRGFVIVPVLFLVAILFGCGEVPVETTAKDETTTLMVYMIGSDLEAKGGAGTRDLQEMLDSGVDLSKVNVLVYAGGSPYWHNEHAAAEEHTLLRLTEDGIHKDNTFDVTSMGEAACLTNFLQYSVEHYPADRYALILWDHGDGPVIGYGKDMLYDNDSLTLLEMGAALDASPFGEECKLDWVGFDACLMASAELACVWAPYAQFMLSSQEIEPAFGWNYQFLGRVGKMPTQELLADITESYLESCLAYYEQRGFDHRDTTLSCVDLSLAQELSGAIDSLFSCAAADVDGNYDQLTLRRAQTRALGRATTGSEYDLIDLQDLALQMSSLYPQEAQVLQDVLQRMVVSNATNAQGCCGLSLYYPFYNKTYFEKEWQEAYSSLGLFSAYQTYLSGYARQWMGDDKLVVSANMSAPAQTGDDRYSLRLTEEQAASYADAHYYILQREGEELYTVLFASAQVEKEGQELIASFDGDILYVKDRFGQYAIPVSVEHDTVGDITRYSVYANLSNRLSYVVEKPEDYEYISKAHRFHLAVNTKSKDISVSALVPYDAEVDAESLNGGKVEDVQLTEWNTCVFPSQRHRYLARYDNGTLKPVSQWPASSVYTGYQFSAHDGIEFVYAPLVTGEYYLVFQIEDTQGNAYCSDILPIRTEGQLEAVEAPESIRVKHGGEDALQLYEGEGVVVSLVRMENYSGPTYGVQVENKNDFSVIFSADELFLDDNVYCHDGSQLGFEVGAGQTVTGKYGISFGDTVDLGFIKVPKSMQFTIALEESMTTRTVLRDQVVYVDLTAVDHELCPEWLSEYRDFTKPSRQCLATEQVLCQTENVRITLMGLGGNELSTDIRMAFKVENLSSESWFYGQLLGITLDNVYFSAVGPEMAVPPGCILYFDAGVNDETLERSNVTSVSKATVTMRIDQHATMLGMGGFSSIERYPVELSQKGSGSIFPTGGRVLFDENGVRIKLLSYEEDDYSWNWYVSVENNSNADISIDMTQATINGTAYSDDDDIGHAVYDGEIGAGERTVSRFAFITFDPFELEQMSFRLRFMDMTKQKTLYVGDTVITLDIPAK